MWDAGSAQAIQEIGAQAIATSSWSVAAAHGYEDGEKISLDSVIQNLKQIIAKTNLPVTIDIEGGYGTTPSEIQQAVIKIIETGAVGINIEDQIIGTKHLHSIEEQFHRIKAARQASEQLSIPIFINARTDIFFKNESVDNHENYLENAISRAHAYAEAGANGFFIPGLTNVHLIEQLCTRSPIPINTMIFPKMPSIKQLIAIGVARISYGANPYCIAMNALKEAGRHAFSIN